MATSEEVREWVNESLRHDLNQRKLNPGRPALQLGDIELWVKGKLRREWRDAFWRALSPHRHCNWV